jgi:cytochrome P450
MLTGYDTDRRGLDWVRSCLAGERAATGVGFNPLRESFRRDPEPGYAELRERSPVHFSRLLDCWVVTRHREVEEVLRTPDVYASDASATTQDLTDPYVLLDPDRPSLFLVDPPDHTRLRGVVNEAFSRAAVERLLPRLETCVRAVVAGLGEPGDVVDLVPRFASVVPLRALDLVTGLRTRELDTVAGWVADVVRALEPIATARTAARSAAAYRALGAYVDERRTRPYPADTLCGALQQAVRSGRLSDPEARQLLVFVVLAGTKTSADFLASAARHLAALPVDAPERRQVDAARVEELLTLVTPVQLVARTATRPAVLAGQRIEAGQRVLLALVSANRDLGGRPPVTFGRGIHLCPGSHFARAQARLALSMLLARYPGIRLTGATPSRRCITLRSWESVLVRL